MEWRCTFCGKPHAEDDPPCDNCGHNKFERAVEQFNAETVPSDPIWVCTECGRQHQKNSPPCSRCGNVDLEKRQPDYELDDLGGTSYLDVLEPKYVAGYVAVALLGGVLLLAFAGVISLPTLGGGTVPDAPGEATTHGNVSIPELERAFVRSLNDRREERGLDRLERERGLDRMAIVYNKGRVAREYADGENVTVREAVGASEYRCDRPIVYDPLRYPPVSLEAGGPGAGNETAIAEAMQVVSLGDGDGHLSPDYRSIGVDFHVATDDQVYGTLFFC